MFRIPILFLLQAFCFQLTAQINITGKVFNDVSGEPLAGASVYINNSTIGSTTGADGSYTLFNVMPGTYDIIVTFVSFEAIIHRVSVGMTPLKFTFRMNEKVTQMRNILVMSDEMRRNRIEKFRELFLGITLAADRSRILNEDDILFEGGEKKSEIIAFSEQPLIIVNRELGYRIYFDLKEFYLNEEEGLSYFVGYTRFEDLEGSNARKSAKKRLQYYLGSTMHFYHSLTDGNAEENDFRIFLVKDMQGTGLKAKIPVPGDSILGVDTVSQLKYIDVRGIMIVNYLKDPYHKSHLKTKTLLQHAADRGIESSVSIIENPCFLDKSGILENPMSVRYSGFWGFEKLANMLPVDYNPPGRKPAINPLRTEL
jgi:CarboxypepD_reg-like domain